MRMIGFFRTLGTTLAFLILLTCAAEPRADVVILKDGFTLTGKIRRETKKEVENGFLIPVGTGFFMVDDDVRRIIFSFRLIPNESSISPQNVNQGPDYVVLKQPFTPYTTAARIEPFAAILDTTPFDDNWFRTLKFLPTKGNPVETKQRITYLTPHFTVVESQRHLWQSMYLTRELGPDVVRQLLYSHPDLREKVGQVDPLKRMRIFRFLLQAGWYNAAELELEQLLKDAPAEKERVESARQVLRRQRSQEMLDDLENGQKAGRHLWVQKQLAHFPEAWAADKALVQLRTLKSKYEAAEEAVTTARRLLKELPEQVSPASQKTLFAEAAAAIQAELNLDNYERLETFVKLAKQAERDRKESRPVTQTPADLLALAVSGWLLGSSSAEAKAETGIRLWNARKFVQEYQKTASANARATMLAHFEKNRTDAIPFDELAQLLRFLPPVEPEPKLSTDLMPLTTRLPGLHRGKGVDYVLQLPKEYHHSRSYPVLVVLHGVGQKPADALERWINLGQQHGYILVAPDWGSVNFRPGYTYSAEEHQPVLDTLRDLRRRFNVDSDRIFLTGHGVAGEMAYDVGLSHPDLFAGVIPMGAQPRFFGRSYAVNGQFTGFYVVCGDLAGETPKGNRDQFKTWVQRGAPALYVEYKGRGYESFDGELPTIFDWMGRQKRKTAVPELSECVAMRPTDNRFYWLSGDGLNEKCINDINRWNYLLVGGTLQGRIAEGNQIHLNVKNWKKVTVWFSPGMIDFDKPVTVIVNTNTRVKDRKITPNLATLLEDFYERGDPHRLFLAKLELPL